MDDQVGATRAEDIRQIRVQKLQEGEYSPKADKWITSDEVLGQTRYDWTQNDFFNSNNTDPLANVLRLTLMVAYFGFMLCVMVVIFGSLR